MAQPIQHDTASSIATVGKSAVKGGVLGIIAAGLIGAAVGAAAIIAGGAVVTLGLYAAGALVTAIPTFGLAPLGMYAAGVGPGTALTYGANFMMGSGALLTGIGAAASGLWSATTFGTTGAIAGGLLGLLSGSGRVSDENAAYQQKLAAHSHARGNKMAKKINDAQIQGLQAGYMLGAQETEQRIVAQLQNAMQEEMLRQQMPAQQQVPAAPVAAGVGAIAAAGQEKSFAAQFDQKCRTECDTHVKGLVEERNAKAAAVAAGAIQVG